VHLRRHLGRDARRPQVLLPRHAPSTGRTDRALEDSPFPVVGASPWEILGAPDSVVMQTEDSFVGEHTPLVSAGSGIRQRDLGVVAGKQYEGYVWLRAPEGAGDREGALVWAEGDAGRQTVVIDQIGAEYRKYPLKFTAGAAPTGPCWRSRVRARRADRHGLADAGRQRPTGCGPIRWPA
jgi:hypothetical protein